MFKFMKSKKGFSLVELMIVVVIMAILVAVAVPIFNSVTGNSRAKTCIDNQRQIISVLGNELMMAGATSCTDTITITNNDGTPTYAVADGGNADKFTVDGLKTLFKTAPYCPTDGSVITVTFTANPTGTATVNTVCTHTNDQNNPHKLETGGSASA